MLHGTIINNAEDIIVTADLNAEEGDPNYDLLSESVKDTFLKNQRWKYTYVSPNKKNHRYDRILNNFDKGYSIIDPIPLKNKISDHTGMFYCVG